MGSIGDKLKILKLNKRIKAKSIEAIHVFEPPPSSIWGLRVLGSHHQPLFYAFPFGDILEPDLRTSSRMFEFVYKMFGAQRPFPRAVSALPTNSNKLSRTEFRFNTEVPGVTSDHIQLASGESIPHEG